MTTTRPLLTFTVSPWWGRVLAAAGARLVSLDDDLEATGVCKWQHPMTAEEPEETVSEPVQRSHVVVLTDPSGQRYLSSTSLLTEQEAEGEAASWRRTDVPGSSERWTAEVCTVLTPAELEEAARGAALEVAANWEVA